MKIYFIVYKMIVTAKEYRLDARQYVSLLNRFLEYDFIDFELVNNVIFSDPNNNPANTLLYLDSEGVIRGIVSFITERKVPSKYPQDLANFKIIACEKGFENKLVELIRYAENIIQLNGNIKSIVIYAYAPWYISPGIDERYSRYIDVLEEMGYRVIDRAVDYIIDMEYFFVPSHINKIYQKLIEMGYRFRYIDRDEDLDVVIRWVEKTFHSIWAIETSLVRGKNTSGVIVAEYSNEIIGFSVYGATATYRFGPIGIEQSHRGKGIGEVMLYMTLKKMREIGNRYIIIPWTSHLYFYAGVPGISKIRKYLIYGKQIK